MSKLNQLFQSNNNYFSFLYQDLYSGYTVSYNEESPIFTASTIKAPAMIYLYEEASKGKINLNEKLTYTSNFYSGGSGILQTKPVGTSYTIEQLIQYSIHDSDNIAYRMLMNHYGRKNILNYWKNLETKNIYTLDTIWGVTSAKDASIYMKEMYRFSKENNTYRKRLLQYFKGAEWKLITNKDGTFNTANKGGWSGTAIHDVAIVFEKNPYLLIIMSNTGESDYQYLFQTTSKLVGQMHEEYWKYKVQKCGSINLY
ncbi:MAG: class A beta-lactamase-related serine hydrolase [Bacilli bacterium]|nr:class A beta-lactamase-related serine hydrolase [Bacilli bacterium]